MEIFKLVISAIFVNNILLAKFLGNCPFLGVSKRMDTAIGMSGAVVFVLTLASLFTWLVHRFILVPLELEYMQTLAFILTIAALVQLVEMFMKKTTPALYRSLGIFLPLITTNCAVLGAALLNVKNEHDFVRTLVFSLASAVGFGLALVIFAGMRERLEISRIPRPLQGTGIGLVTAGLMSLAFFAFRGII